MKMKSAGPHPEETKVPSQGEGGTCHSPRQPATWLKGKQIKRQTGLCALYLMGTVGVWGLRCDREEAQHRMARQGQVWDQKLSWIPSPRP